MVAGTPPKNLELNNPACKCKPQESKEIKKHDVLFKATRAIMRMYNAGTSLSTRGGPPIDLRHCCTTLSKQGNLEATSKLRIGRK